MSITAAKKKDQAKANEERKKRAFDQIDAAFSGLAGRSDKTVEFSKLRATFLDRLAIVNSGTLALSFTAVISLVNRTTLTLHNFDTRALFGAWRLLVLSLICCIIASSRETIAAKFEDDYIFRLEANARLKAIKAYAQPLLPDRELAEALPPVKVDSEKQMKIQAIIARILTILAQTSTFFAFILLYIFAKKLIT